MHYIDQDQSNSSYIELLFFFLMHFIITKTIHTFIITCRNQENRSNHNQHNYQRVQPTALAMSISIQVISIFTR